MYILYYNLEQEIHGPKLNNNFLAKSTKQQNVG